SGRPVGVSAIEDVHDLLSQCDKGRVDRGAFWDAMGPQAAEWFLGEAYRIATCSPAAAEAVAWLCHELELVAPAAARLSRHERLLSPPDCARALAFGCCVKVGAERSIDSCDEWRQIYVGALRGLGLRPKTDDEGEGARPAIAAALQAAQSRIADQPWGQAPD